MCLTVQYVQTHVTGFEKDCQAFEMRFTLCVNKIHTPYSYAPTGRNF